MIDSGGGTIEPDHLLLEAAGAPASPPAPSPSVDELPLNLGKANLALVERALMEAGGNVSKAAKLLGIHRTKVYRILARSEKQ